ncbi:hypothetical protein V6R21_16075 [Limibacter armeniacum]|uniref:hypothetical protein n=1 Tax=Limibacter armeniacum TaxID=466084 RepID=UPI002FE6427A
MNKLCLIIYTLITFPFSAIWAQEAHEEIRRNDELSNFNWQTGKGRLYTGLDYGLGFSVQNKPSRQIFVNSRVTFNATLSPSVGYFVYDRWLVGIHFDNAGSLLTQDYNNEYLLYYYTAGVFTRYYLKWGLFGELRYGYGDGIERLLLSGEKFKFDLNANNYTVGVGISNYWTRRVSFDVIARYNYATLEYSYLKRANSDDDKFSNDGITISAGISVILGKLPKD